MKITHRFWRYLLAPMALAGMLSMSSAAELNPAALVFKSPDQIPWGPVDARGAQSAVVVGDPNKPGFYMVYNKWTKGNHFSRPHFHPNDRYIVVLQGTWWVGTGPKFDINKHDSHARRKFHHAFRQTNPLGWRQGRGCCSGDHGRGSGHVNRGGREIIRAG